MNACTLRRLAGPWLLLALTGCGDRVTHSTPMVFEPAAGAPGDGGMDEPVTLALIQETIIAPSCAISGCHAATVYPNMSSAAATARLVGQPSTAQRPLIAPGDPDGSYLYIKVAGTDGMLGDRMPLGAPPLSAAELELIRDWILTGASQ